MILLDRDGCSIDSYNITGRSGSYRFLSYIIFVLFVTLRDPHGTWRGLVDDDDLNVFFS